MFSVFFLLVTYNLGTTLIDDHKIQYNIVEIAYWWQQSYISNISHKTIAFAIKIPANIFNKLIIKKKKDKVYSRPPHTPYCLTKEASSHF